MNKAALKTVVGRFFNDLSVPFMNVVKLVITSYFILQILLAFSYLNANEIAVLVMSPFCVFFMAHITKWDYISKNFWVRALIVTIISLIGVFFTVIGMSIVQENLHSLGFLLDISAGELVFYGFFLWFNMLLMSFNTDWGKIQKVH